VIQRNRIALVFMVIASATLACSLAGNNSSLEATAEVLGQSIQLTATEKAAVGDNPESSVQTAVAQATQQNQEYQTTQAAMEALSAEAQAGTATAVAPIMDELSKYGVDASQGHIGWIHPPATLDVEGYMQYDYTNQFLGTVASDFVVSADITWNTFTGLSGCGFVLRSDGNLDALNQYLAIATRGASGHVIFATMANGDVVTGQDIYAYGIDPYFQWQNDTTNRLTVIGRGDKFTIYTNDSFLGEIDPSAPPPQPYIPPPPEEPADKTDVNGMAKYLEQKAAYDSVVSQIRSNYQARLKAYENADTKFDRGLIAMVALSESGRTVCHFDNAWLWLIN
jgi:hypothetical protein